MGRESRHLWVGNIPDSTTESQVTEYFTPYGEVDKLELLTTKDSPGGVTAVVSFLSLQIAAKIHKMSHKISNNALTTRYHDFSSNNVSHNNDPKTEVKDKRSRDEPFHRKRSPSPNSRPRGDIKRKIDIGRHPSDRTTSEVEYRKRVIICHNLPSNQSGSALSSGLYHEFKQIGKIKQLWINTVRGVKTAVVMYHDSQVAHMAFDELNRKMLYGKSFDLELVKDKDAYTMYPDTTAEDNRTTEQNTNRSHHPAAAALPRRNDRNVSRRHSDELVSDEGASTTLFVGNLSGNVRYKDLMSLFKRYGDIECIDIKESDKGYPYAFIRFYELKSACAAKRYLNETILHERSMKIGYGKGCQTNTVMAMEIDRQCPESKVEHEFAKYGELVRMTYNETLGSALCTYSDTESAQLAIENIRGRCLGRTGRVKVDFANHEECQEFYKNYEQCKTSQQFLRYQMDILSQTSERDHGRKKFDDFKVEDRRGSGAYNNNRKYTSPQGERRDSQSFNNNKRYERVERTAARNIRDITPPPPPRAAPTTDRRRRRSYETDWKGKEKATSKDEKSGPPRVPLERSSSRRESRDQDKISRVVSSRYNSEERELARHIRDSRNSSRERAGERVDFHPSNMKRVTKKEARSPSRSPDNKYYKDPGRNKESYKSRDRPGSSMMDNNWDSKKYNDDKSRRGGSPREERRPDDRRDKKKKERRSTLSEEEEEILNSLIAIRREEKSRMKRNLRKERDGSESSRRRRSERGKRKRRRRPSKDSSDDSSDDSSSSSSETSEGMIDVGNHDHKQQQEPIIPAPPSDALDRIAKIISDSTNGQVQLNPGTGVPMSETYSPERPTQDLPPPVHHPAMIPIPPAVVQPFLPPPQIQVTQSKELLGLLRKYPIMWNGSIALKNDTANVQLHFLSGSAGIAEGAITALPNLGPGPMRIAQRMRLEPNQIEGVQKRMQHEGQWCMMLALPHGTDPVSVSNQTTTLQHGFISYLESKQAAGIINLPVQDLASPYVLHIFPPCEFTQIHMKKFCPELIDGAGDCGYLLIVIATV